VLELLLDGAVLLQALQVDPAEQKGEDNTVLVEHAPGYPAVAGLEEAGRDHVQTLRVVCHLAKVWKISRKFGKRTLFSSGSHLLDQIFLRRS
jgi:hypothetical protein